LSRNISEKAHRRDERFILIAWCNTCDLIFWSTILVKSLVWNSESVRSLRPMLKAQCVFSNSGLFFVASGAYTERGLDHSGTIYHVFCTAISTARGNLTARGSRKQLWIPRAFARNARFVSTNQPYSNTYISTDMDYNKSNNIRCYVFNS
jgi:hypothetical protein